MRSTPGELPTLRSAQVFKMRNLLDALASLHPCCRVSESVGDVFEIWSDLGHIFRVC